MKSWLWLISILAIFSSAASAKKLARVKAGLDYKENDDVHIIVNSVGPFNNPVEKYRYYSFPFCTDHDDHDKKGALKHRQRLREAMAGDRRESSPYAIKYGDNVDYRVLCKKRFGSDDLKMLKDAIENSYFFEMYVEDLPMYGFLGDIENENLIQKDITGEGGGITYLYPHLEFQFGMNKGKIVSAFVQTDVSKAVDITDTSIPKEIEFSYSVLWTEKDLEWKDRMTSYLNSSFSQPRSLEIHWLSIINSCVLVILLLAFLVIIFMRILKNDFSRYMDIEEDTIDEEESGWKLISGDVFRTPGSPTLFCAAVGTGTQLMVTCFIVLLLALTGMVSTTRRGSILACAVITYTLTSVVGGYISTKLYFQMSGKAWARTVVVTTLLFPAPVGIVFAWANSVAMAHGSISALPFSTIVTILSLYVFVCLPLTLLGGILAKQYAKKDLEAPTRTTKVAREIPTEIPLHSNRYTFMFVAGFLPFTAIYVELHYIFSSMWGHQIYTMFGVLFCAYCLLVIVTSAITVSLIYFQLSREDHRWWWSAFVNGGMIGFFIYAYSFYFYIFNSGMSGFLQASFYFGYMAILSFATFLMLGSAGFRVSLLFVKYIYSRVKCD
mmetsp:Transcript_11998/g.22452  ORF Transcript_11998/g.22452 Transcript_11998/m.22452 type:complete len:609 (+) Transcript_11998:180-2006(+)